MLRRALHDPAVQGGEQSMAGHLIRIDRGDRSHVGLPVFPLRNFTARDLYVRKGGAVREPPISPARASACSAGPIAAACGIGISFAGLASIWIGCNGGSATSTRRARAA